MTPVDQKRGHSEIVFPMSQPTQPANILKTTTLLPPPRTVSPCLSCAAADLILAQGQSIPPTSLATFHTRIGPELDEVLCVDTFPSHYINNAHFAGNCLL